MWCVHGKFAMSDFRTLIEDETIFFFFGGGGGGGGGRLLFKLILSIYSWILLHIFLIIFD